MAIAKALGTSMDDLVSWVDDARPTHQIASELKTKVAPIRDLEEGHAEPLDPDWHEHVGIDEIDTTVGADGTVGDERIPRRVKFPYPWLRKHGLRAHMCRIVRVAGEAMEPTVPDGCAILIDTASTDRRDGRIFVVRSGDELIIRRLVHDPEAGWLLRSDNRRSPRGRPDRGPMRRASSARSSGSGGRSRSAPEVSSMNSGARDPPSSGRKAAGAAPGGRGGWGYRVCAGCACIFCMAGMGADAGLDAALGRCAWMSLLFPPIFMALLSGGARL